MGEFLWVFAVEEVLKKVVKLASEQIGLLWGFEKELSKLRKWLLKSESILRDINERKLHHHSVSLWVEDLQHLVHEADDILDELVYEDLRQKVEVGTMKKVRNFVSPSNNAIVFRGKMAKRMKNIIKLLYKHHCEASPLGLLGCESIETVELGLNQLRDTISELDDFEIVGRDIEVSSIVKQVIDASKQQVTCILPIVGMGGLGKTTLAKLVFNHEMIKEHYDKFVWVCVSQPFLVNSILRAILQTLKGTYSGLDNKEMLLRELQKEMCGKRYFLVLDDVWNENVFLWDELKYCLTRITGKFDNSILVTTRSIQVAKMMESFPSHHLTKLSDDQCWTVFKKSANAYGLSMTSNLEVQEELVKKFGGLPLVARVIGRAIKFQGDYERWVTILESLARAPLQENFASSMLKLSVDHLPSSSLKQCFAYCSNFPKDFEFKKEQLIQMWIAQGFIQPHEERTDKTMEDIGDMYFNILLSRCLFQDVAKDDRGKIIYCKMHDLIHDIACVVSKDQELKLDSNNLLDMELCMNGSENFISKLRTIVFIEKMLHEKEIKVIHDKILKFVRLRVLFMNSQSINKLPNSIGKLKHLRYLNISGCPIEKLPESIVSLYNLQTLSIKDTLIVDLPENLRDLVNLRHLEFSDFGFYETKQMPPNLSQLIQLQTLSNFVAGSEKGCKVTELGPLKHLKGSLNLSKLERVMSKEEAKTAKLVEKENLSELTFEWSLFCGKEDHNHSYMEVLEGLQPHKNLQFLNIKHFPDKLLPNNIFVENLVAIHLHESGICELPMLGQLTHLEELQISFLSSLRSIGNEFYGNDLNQRTFFPKLKKFELRWLKNLKQWEEVTFAKNVTIFPRLEVLDIFNCPMLLNIPNLFGFCDENGVEHFRILNIWKCPQLTDLPSGLQFCHSIRHMKIDHCNNLTVNMQNKLMLSSLRISHSPKLPEKLANLTNLKELVIIGCIQKYDFGPLMHLRSLIKISLVDQLGSATQLPQQLEHLTSLQHLSIQDFGGIEVLPEWLKNLTSLQTLSLSFCKNLKLLPSKEAMLHLTKLSRVDVFQCPQLQLRQSDLEGAKLPTIGIQDDDYFFSNIFTPSC